jgi:hypothetical protein
MSLKTGSLLKSLIISERLKLGLIGMRYELSFKNITKCEFYYGAKVDQHFTSVSNVCVIFIVMFCFRLVTVEVFECYSSGFQCGQPAERVVHP